MYPLWMYLLEPMSAEPPSSLYESADQPPPSSSASPQCTSRLNFEESQIAVVINADDAGKQWSNHICLFLSEWMNVSVS